MTAGSAESAVREAALRDMVTGFLQGYTGPPAVAADELIRMVRQWDTAGSADYLPFGTLDSQTDV